MVGENSDWKLSADYDNFINGEGNSDSAEYSIISGQFLFLSV